MGCEEPPESIEALSKHGTDARKPRVFQEGALGLGPLHGTPKAFVK